MQESRALLVLKLFELYYERVYGFSARRSVDGSTAEDIAQEVFTRLLEVPELEKKSIESSYLIKIADNLLKRRYRRAQTFDTIVEKKSRELRASTGPKHGRDRDGTKSLRERQGQAVERLGDLTEREYDAVRLIVCRGLSYQEAAASLGVKLSAINNWKFRGIQRLRHHDESRVEGEHGARAGRDPRRGRIGKRAS